MAAESGRTITIDGEQFTVSAHTAAKMESMAAQLALKDKALREVEWVDVGQMYICIACRSSMSSGHTATCIIAKALSPSLTDAK